MNKLQKLRMNIVLLQKRVDDYADQQLKAIKKTVEALKPRMSYFPHLVSEHKEWDKIKELLGLK